MVCPIPRTETEKTRAEKRNKLEVWSWVLRGRQTVVLNERKAQSTVHEVLWQHRPTVQRSYQTTTREPHCLMSTVQHWVLTTWREDWQPCPPRPSAYVALTYIQQPQRHQSVLFKFTHSSQFLFSSQEIIFVFIQSFLPLTDMKIIIVFITFNFPKSVYRFSWHLFS